MRRKTEKRADRTGVEDGEKSRGKSGQKMKEK